MSEYIEARPAATLSTNYVPRTFQSIDFPDTQTAEDQDTITVTESLTSPTSPVISLSASASTSYNHIMWEGENASAAHHLRDVTAAFKGIISAQLSKSERHGPTKAALNVTSKPYHENTTEYYVADSRSVSIAAIDIIDGSIVFLNTTAPNYMLIDYANASVMIWTASDTTLTTPESRLHKVVDGINTWLPYIEALSILAVGWKVIDFVYDKFRRRRGRAVPSEMGDGL